MLDQLNVFSCPIRAKFLQAAQVQQPLIWVWRCQRRNQTSEREGKKSQPAPLPVPLIVICRPLHPLFPHLPNLILVVTHASLNQCVCWISFFFFLTLNGVKFTSSESCWIVWIFKVNLKEINYAIGPHLVSFDTSQKPIWGSGFHYGPKSSVWKNLPDCV